MWSNDARFVYFSWQNVHSYFVSKRTSGVVVAHSQHTQLFVWLVREVPQHRGYMRQQQQQQRTIRRGSPNQGLTGFSNVPCPSHTPPPDTQSVNGRGNTTLPRVNRCLWRWFRTEVGLQGSLMVTAAVTGAWTLVWRGQNRPELYWLQAYFHSISAWKSFFYRAVVVSICSLAINPTTLKKVISVTAGIHIDERRK